MRKPTVRDLPGVLRDAILEALPALKGRESDTLVRVLRPRDGFFHRSNKLRDEKRPVLAFSTVKWELDTPSGALRFDPLEPVLLEPRPTRRGLLKFAIGTAAAALVGVPLLLQGKKVQASSYLNRFARSVSFSERAEILNQIYGAKTREARALYVQILLSPWPVDEAKKMVGGALTGLEVAGDQYLYTLACYFVLYARPEYELKTEAVQRLAKLKDPLVRDNLKLLKQQDPKLYQECIKLLLR